MENYIVYRYLDGAGWLRPHVCDGYCVPDARYDWGKMGCNFSFMLIPAHEYTAS